MPLRQPLLSVGPCFVPLFPGSPVGARPGRRSQGVASKGVASKGVMLPDLVLPGVALTGRVHA